MRKLLCIIISWNRPDFLRRTLESLFLKTGDIETLVVTVDNGSDWMTRTILDQEERIGKCVFLESNLGINRALEAALPDDVSQEFQHILISDADMGRGVYGCGKVIRRLSLELVKIPEIQEQIECRKLLRRGVYAWSRAFVVCVVLSVGFVWIWKVENLRTDDLVFYWGLFVLPSILAVFALAYARVYSKSLVNYQILVKGQELQIVAHPVLSDATIMLDQCWWCEGRTCNDPGLVEAIDHSALLISWYPFDSESKVAVGLRPENRAVWEVILSVATCGRTKPRGYAEAVRKHCACAACAGILICVCVAFNVAMQRFRIPIVVPLGSIVTSAVIVSLIVEKVFSHAMGDLEFINNRFDLERKCCAVGVIGVVGGGGLRGPNGMLLTGLAIYALQLAAVSVCALNYARAERSDPRVKARSMLEVFPNT